MFWGGVGWEGLSQTGSGGYPGRAATAHRSPGCESRGDPENLGERKQRYALKNEGAGVLQRECMHWVLCLRVFNFFRKAGILGEFSGEDLNRILYLAVYNARPRFWPKLSGEKNLPF